MLKLQLLKKDSLLKIVIMIKKLLICFLLLSTNCNSQDSTKLSRDFLKSGLVKISASYLPYHVAVETYKYNKTNTYSYLYTTAWFCVGVTLDISGVSDIVKSSKLRKKLK